MDGPVAAGLGPSCCGAKDEGQPDTLDWVLQKERLGDAVAHIVSQFVGPGKPDTDVSAVFVSCNLPLPQLSTALALLPCTQVEHACASG